MNEKAQNGTATSEENHLAWIEGAKQEFEEIKDRSSIPGGIAPIAFAGDVDAIADSLPGYAIESEIHRGGQGVVYKSIQKATRREVAIKVMRQGPFAGPQDRARFDREVQILGQLKHPNIVTILDSGSSAGNFFFIMDYVGGMSLDDYALKHDLPVREALKLFAKICDAVNVAHLRGIIHRDLKPSNIRVDPSGEPHVMDFGLAKVDEFDVIADSPGYVQTQTGQFIGSLPWASPEQVEGRPEQIDIRTDIYSLGVMLFQILTHRFPYDVSGGIRDVLNCICNVYPPRPSSINSKIDDEVDHIVLKCLRKDKEDRYQSSGNLAREIRRYLNGEPLESKRDSIGYVLRKQLKRHKLPVAIAASFAVLIAVGFFVSLAFWHRAAVARDVAAEQREIAESNEIQAKTEASKAKAVNDFLQDMLSSADPYQEGRDVLVRDVLRDAVRKIEEGAFNDQPEQEAAIRRTIGVTYRALGFYEEAEPLLRTALSLTAESLGEEHRDTLVTLEELGALLHHKGTLEEAESLLREAIEKQRRVLGENSADTLSSMNDLASVLQDQGKYDESKELYQHALEIGNNTLGSDHDLVLLISNNLASLFLEIGILHEAERLHRQVLDIRTRVNGENHPETITSVNNLGLVLRAQRRLDEAEPLFVRALEGARRIWGEDHAHTVSAMNNLGILKSFRGKLPEAEDLLRRSLDIGEKNLGTEHPVTLNSLNTLAGVLKARGNLNEATGLYRQLVKTRRRVQGDEHPYTLITINLLVELLAIEGKHEEAESLYKEVLDSRKRTLGEEHLDTLMVEFHLANVYRDQGRILDAEPIYRRVVEITEKTSTNDQWQVPAMRATWGACLLELERYAEAETQLRSAHTELARIAGEHHPVTMRAIEELAALYDAWDKDDQASQWRDRLKTDSP